MKDKISVENLHLYYGDFHALKGVNLGIRPFQVTAVIGPSGCGKSTFLRCLNRMNDLVEGVRVEGRILLDGEEVLRSGYDLVNLRKRVGMVFQRPNPFPLSIFENVAFGLKIHNLALNRRVGTTPPLEGIAPFRGLSPALPLPVPARPAGGRQAGGRRAAGGRQVGAGRRSSERNIMEGIVEKSLCAVGLWEELKDSLENSALRLSLEQQQRLCIARLLAVNPEVLLMDEPCSALDPVATLRIEELIREMKTRYTIVIVTHNMQQAARISGETAYFYLGELVEVGPTERLFTKPEKQETEDYITGRFG